MDQERPHERVADARAPLGGVHDGTPEQRGAAVRLESDGPEDPAVISSFGDEKVRERTRNPGRGESRRIEQRRHGRIVGLSGWPQRRAGLRAHDALRPWSSRRTPSATPRAFCASAESPRSAKSGAAPPYTTE